MTFTEDWMSAGACRALGQMVRQTQDVPGRIVEVGCWEGKSTVALANAAAPTTLHVVDTWEGSRGEISADLAAERNVLATFMQNITDFTQGNIEIHRQDWRVYFDADRTPIRFLHIDAEHSYQEVYDNIDSALPLLSKRGIICGDDLAHPPVADAVKALLPDAICVASRLWAWRNE